MNRGGRKRSPKVAFIPIGIALMVVGMNTNGGLIGAGAVFFIIGLAAIAQSRMSQGSGDKPEV